jgi:chromosome segregation ATPase
LREIEQALDESNARFESAHLDHLHQLEAAGGLWAAERQELIAQWEHERQSFSEAASWHEEKNRAVADYQSVQDRLTAALQESEQDRKSFRAELEVLRCAAESLREERDTALQQAERLRHERDELAERLSQAEASQRDTEQRRRDELAGLTQERDEARRHAAHLAERRAELTDRLQTLRESLKQQARDFEMERQALHEGLADLQRELEARDREQWAAEREETLRPEPAPRENGADVSAPLVLHHDEHKTPPAPHCNSQVPDNQAHEEGEDGAGFLRTIDDRPDEQETPGSDLGSSGEARVEDGAPGTPSNKSVPDPNDSVEV